MIKYEYDATGNRVQRYWYGWPIIKSLKPDSAGQATRPLENVVMHVYPNPAKDILQVSLAAAVGFGTLKVLDAQGRSVLTQKNAGPITQLDVSGLEVAPYFLSFMLEEERLVMCFAVSR